MQEVQSLEFEPTGVSCYLIWLESNPLSKMEAHSKLSHSLAIQLFETLSLTCHIMTAIEAVLNRG